ncbi:hypothetical protein [Paenibacillus alvei]|uniref:hypothetical protein n=1 Tax=Paenibacillus alvei TaxID=44250 RepID=UPI0018CE589E|nr:hypothetical protein [Paenibacillus alvei]MBG9734955.1 hypothetical protein [Paenibacillus alvei]MBG9744830.1 hypothetical protein [Paenibacillus alvei]MCY9578724.1 hypothetical protein [Paenibacillus alvei]MCY9583782.1 hypothetical protein [Paenibacillus alvei]
MDKKEQVVLEVWDDKISINISGTDKLAFVDYTPGMYDLIRNARFRIPESEEVKKKYKYPYSNEYKKTLHQISFDYYFGEEFRKEAYNKDYIIEHLDNNGFNCSISNLFLLKKIKNTYKGWNFDKVVHDSKHIAALTIYHVLENRTFQITIAFNEAYRNASSGKSLGKVRLLYSYNYEIVLQDAEQIIEAISNREDINFERWKEIYRFKDLRVEYEPELELTEEEKKQPPGTLVMRDGQYYLLIGKTETSIGIVNSIPYDKNWNIE